MAAQFAANEAARAIRREQIDSARAAFERRVDALTASAIGREPAAAAERFVAASDELALLVVGQQRIPEGVDLFSSVARIRATYNRLPQVPVPCEMRRVSYLGFVPKPEPHLIASFHR